MKFTRPTRPIRPIRPTRPIRPRGEKGQGIYLYMPPLKPSKIKGYSVWGQEGRERRGYGKKPVLKGEIICYVAQTALSL